jgi:predicted  nucleic acid-binding Zn-ribbon protein
VPRLLERVIQQRRHAGAEVATPGDTDADHEQRIAALERRLEDLENLLEGLQDSVHRETVRLRKEIQELERNTTPAEIARSLGRHAREHGI